MCKWNIFLGPLLLFLPEFVVFWLLVGLHWKTFSFYKLYFESLTNRKVIDKVFVFFEGKSCYWKV